MEDRGVRVFIPGCSWLLKELHRVQSVACGMRRTGLTAQSTPDALNSSVPRRARKGLAFLGEWKEALCLCWASPPWLCGDPAQLQGDTNFTFL